MPSSTSACSLRPKRPKTKSICTEASRGAPTPKRRRGNACPCRCAISDFSPLCPPADPSARRRSLPSGRAMSSVTTRYVGHFQRLHSQERRHGLPRQVHKGLRLHQKDPRVCPRARRRSALDCLFLCNGNAMLPGKRLHHGKADVVARIFVFLARIAQPDNKFRGRVHVLNGQRLNDHLNGLFQFFRFHAI